VEVAKELGIKTVIIPSYGGIFSAFGLLCADIERNYVRAFDYILDKDMLAKANEILSGMVSAALASAQQHGHEKSAVRINKYADVRYKKQASDISVLLPEGDLSPSQVDRIHASFDEEHQLTFGHSFPDMPLEVVNLRVVSSISIEKPVMGTLKETTRQFSRKRAAFRKAYWGSEIGFLQVPVIEITDVGERPLEGPVFIDTYDTTIVVPPGARISSGLGGSLIIDILDSEASHV
jgi:N-methylhydantoinase A/oxoprolinase/acetone carboxylase beta subunit